jgi:3-hydroxybutyryl-CoA dehydratase
LDEKDMNTFASIKVGEKAHFSKTIGETDLYLYCGISGDFNPLHVDQIYASKGLFRGKIVHGLLVASFISNVLGTQLPGPGTIYLSQDLSFINPVYIGDTVTTTVEVLKKISFKKHMILRIFCANQGGEIVLDGKARVLFDPEMQQGAS